MTLTFILTLLESLRQNSQPLMATQNTRAYQATHLNITLPTPLASRGVGLFIDELLDYKVMEKSSNQAFQALWIEISLFANEKNAWNHLPSTRLPEVFQTYFEETVEKFALTNKAIYIMGDFNIDLIKCEISHFSHNFLLHLQSCYLIPTVDKPTRVQRASISHPYW